MQRFDDRQEFVKPKTDWRQVQGSEQFFTDQQGRGVVVSIQHGVTEGKTIYGVKIQYPERFLTLGIKDVVKLRESLEQIEKKLHDLNIL